MYRERFEELKHSGKLPSPSSVGMRILMLTQDEDCDLDEVVAAIQGDPALTGRVIRLATSVQHGGVKIATVREASMRIGLRAVCNTALSFTVVSGNRTGRCRAFDYDEYWGRALATAVAAELIARETGEVEAPEAFTLGLLARIGSLGLASVHPETYAEVLERTAGKGDSALLAAEQEAFFIDHRQVGAALLEDWGLPGDFIETALRFDGRSVEGEFDHERTPVWLRTLNAAEAMARVCVSDAKRQPFLWPGLKRQAAALELTDEAMRALFDQVTHAWRDWGEILEVPTKSVSSAAELEARSDPSKLSAEPRPDQGLRILAVDDDPVSLKVLVALLRRDGHSVMTATNGREALAMYLEHGAEVVITDWMMPEMDGVMLCRQLRKTEEGRKLYILILTGQTEQERIVEAFEVGVDDHIGKPFKPELLRARLQPAKRVIALQKDNDQQVHEKERLNRQLDIEKRKFKNAAMTDALTELPNRRHALDRLERRWAGGADGQGPFSVIMVDIDHFKQVNDTWGHDIGDVVLRETSRAIANSLRRGDLCARIGGEEFLVICPNTASEEGAAAVAERMRAAVEANEIDSGPFHGKVTISVGVALATPTVESIDALLKIADEAVYESKNGGRNRVTIGRHRGGSRKSA